MRLQHRKILKRRYKKLKARLKALEREALAVSELITQDLGAIGTLHDELEEYYKRAVDYKKLDMLTKKLLIKLFCDKA